MTTLPDTDLPTPDQIKIQILTKEMESLIDNYDGLVNRYNILLDRFTCSIEECQKMADTAKCYPQVIEILTESNPKPDSASYF